VSVPWPHPRRTELSWISYSSVGALRDCQLAVAFAADTRFAKARRLTQFTALGRVVHRVIEKALSGQYEAGVADSAKDVARRLWQECEEEAWDELQSEWAPAEPPDPHTWPFYAQRKVQTVRAISAVTETGISSTPRKYGQAEKFEGQPVLPWVERPLSDDARQIRGTPDRVERRDDGVWVVDLKTGANQGKPTANQRDQLLLYAHLVSTNLGERPVGLSVETPDGHEFSLDFAWSDVEQHVETLLGLRASFNAAQWPLQGSPSEQACRYCAYQGLCRDFYSAREPDWTRFVPLVGRMKKVAGELPWLSVDICIQEPQEFVDAVTHVVGVPWEVRPDVDDVVSVSSVNLVGGGALARGNWNSLTWNFHQIED